MDATVATPLPAGPPTFFEWLCRELAPTPGRGLEAFRIAATTVLVVIISMALQVPELIISAYMVILISKENKKVTTMMGVLLIIGVTIGIAVSILAYHFTFDYPELRIPAMAAILFTGFFALRTLAIGPLGLGIGFIFAATQSVAELMPNAEYLVRWLLWLWVAVTYPIALTVIVHNLHVPVFLGGSVIHENAQPRPRKPMLAPDAFTNPAHVHFALKVTLAAMTCYFIYTGLDWPGIHTAFITCCFISLESLGATLHKGGLRLGGCAAGGLIGFLSSMYLVPHMVSITSLVMLVGAVVLVAGWVAAGSPRIAYAGLQIALAFYMCILQKFQPDTDFTDIRDRLAGIVLGIVVTTLTYRFIWPVPDTEG